MCVVPCQVQGTTLDQLSSSQLVVTSHLRKSPGALVTEPLMQVCVFLPGHTREYSLTLMIIKSKEYPMNENGISKYLLASEYSILA